MPSPVDSARRIQLENDAIEWLVRLRSEELNDKDMTAFANWLAEDYHHSEAFAQAEELFDDMRLAATTMAVQATVPIALIKSPIDSRPVRRRVRNWLGAAFATAAIWLFAVMLVIPNDTHPLQRLLSDYHTATGEMREILLADGSRVSLDTNTAISLRYSDQGRQILLHHGQALFKVAPDPRRPFEVVAGPTSSRALGTIFSVKRFDDQKTQITVQEHAVRVSIDSSGAVVDLAAGQRLRYREGDASPAIEKVDLAESIAWQQHRLVIDDRPLSELIAELNRYRLGRVFLADAALGELRITGIFSLDNPEAIPASVSAVLGLREKRINNWWTILDR